MGSTTSDFFNTSNSVRQGGILFNYLFTVYVDDLSNMLNSAGTGCHIYNCCTNHMFYVLLRLVPAVFRLCSIFVQSLVLKIILNIIL